LAASPPPVIKPKAVARCGIAAGKGYEIKLMPASNRRPA